METYSGFVQRHKKVFALLVALLAIAGGFYYNQIQDNQSVYEMLNINHEIDRYYVEEYAAHFGKDDFVYVAFESDDPFSDTVRAELALVHGILEGLAIRFDPVSGTILWAEDPDRRLSEKIRHLLKPVRVEVAWDGERGRLVPSIPEQRKHDDSIAAVPVQKSREDGREIGIIPAVRFALSLHNHAFLDGDSDDVSRDLKRLLADPLIGSFLVSDIQSFDPETGREERGAGKIHLMAMAQMHDFKARDELRQAVHAELTAKLRHLAAKTGHVYHLAGIPILNAETTKTVSNDHFEREPLIFVFIIITLLLLFRGKVRAILFPVGVMMVSLLITLGLFERFGGEFNWLTAILPLMLIIVSLSDSIHIMEYFHKELAPDLALTEKIRLTVRENWKPCLFTCVTNLTGMLSLVLWPESPRQLVMFGIFGAVGLVVALVVTYTLFPLMAGFFVRTARGTLVASTPDRATGFFHAVFRFCHSSHRLVLLALIVLLPLLYRGIARIEATVDVKNYFRGSTTIGRSLEYIHQHFRGLGTYAVVVTQPRQSQAAAVLPAIPGDSDTKPLTLRLGKESLAALQQTVACYRRFHAPETVPELTCDWERFDVGNRQGRMTGSVLSIMDLVPGGAEITDPQRFLNALVQLADLDPTVNRSVRFLYSDDGSKTQVLRLTHSESSLPIKQINDRVMADLIGICPPGPDASCQTVFTGIGQVWNQFVQKLTIFLKKSFVTASLGIFLIMMVFFYPRLDLSVLSLLPNLLPTLLILAAVGYMGIPLDMSTAMVASIAMGLLVDDSMHLLHFFKVHLDKTGDFDASVWHALHLSGRAVVTMSCVLAVGFSLLTWGDFLPVVRVGVLLMWIIVAGLVFELIVTPSLLFGIYKPVWKRRISRQGCVVPA